MTAILQAQGAPAAPRIRSGRLGSRVATVVAAVVLVVFALAALVPGLLTGYDPNTPDPLETLQAPSLAHLMGTDYLGRDVLARIVFGAQQTLIGAGVAVLVGLVGGLVLGLLAALLGKAGDALVSRFIDVLLSVPTLLIAIVIVAVLGFGTLYAGLAIGVAAVGQFAKLTRSQLLTAQSLPYVEASRLSGRSKLGTTLTHALPNLQGPILALVPVQFGFAILSLTALGFLGFGVQPPTPEWGSMIADGSTYLISGRWWMVVFPTLSIVAVVLSLNTIGRRLSRVAEGAL